MDIRWPLVFVGIAVVLQVACSDGGPNFFKHDKETIVLFNRVTLASYAQDRAEIEIEVRTGSDFSEMAPDGTDVQLETSFGSFEGGGSTVTAQTLGGRAVVTLLVPEPSRLTVSARSQDAETDLVVDIDEDGSIRLDPS
jgi:hypothetical protein